ncbi:MAG: tryptophan-rich sensory protein [Bacteroidota bacterium]|nr:tryptophan-rich sensory protein [Bacteroidota bacterium]
MNHWVKLMIFFVLNFAALALGSIFTEPGTSSDWYQNLDKAPWTPPGFVFGLAWFTIMLCFSFYMTNITGEKQTMATKSILVIFAVQWILNILWNPLFFGLQLPGIAFIDIVLLFLTVTFFLIIGFKSSMINGLLILPYFLWLIIAISLNAYILFEN